MPSSWKWSAVWLHLGVNPLKLKSSHSCSTFFALFLPSVACFWVHLIHFENFAIWNVSKQNCYTIVGKQNNILSYLVLMWCKVSSIISWFSDAILIHAAVVTKRSLFVCLFVMIWGPDIFQSQELCPFRLSVGGIYSNRLCLALAPRTKQCLEGLLTVDQAFVCVLNSACWCFALHTQS